MELQGVKPPMTTGVEKDHAKVTEALAKLKAYANALAAITNAADRAAFDAAVHDLSGAVGGMTEVFDSVALRASGVLSKLVDLVGWVAGNALDQQRYDVLVASVAKVKPHFRAAIGPLGAGLRTLQTARRGALMQQILFLGTWLETRHGDAETRVAVIAAQAAFAALNTVRAADPVAAASDLAEAHDALAVALADPKPDAGKLLAKVAAFTSKARALDKAFSAGATKTGG